jgi:hypothetical protein
MKTMTRESSATSLVAGERGTWIAERNGELIGRVIRDETGYVSTTGRGKTLGLFTGLEPAVDAIEARADHRDVRQAFAWSAVFLVSLAAAGCVVSIVRLLQP